MIAILADIHANLYALEAVLADMPKVSEIWILGDMTGELPHPCQVLDRLIELPVPVYAIAGNREMSLLEAKNGRHADWWKGTQMRALAWTTDQLQPHHWKYMNNLLPVMPLNTIPDGALLFHGLPQKVRGQMYQREDAVKAVRGVTEHLLVCGHIHKARIHQIGNQTVINAGSVGLSLDGIGGVATYVLLDEKNKEGSRPRAAFRKVTYDVDKTVNEIQKYGLSDLAPGISRAVILELQTGYHHVVSLVGFCHAYAEQYLGHAIQSIPPELWNEAEKIWDGSEWIKGRGI